MFFDRGNSALWKAIRDLQEETRQQQNTIDMLQADARRRSSQRDWILTKFLPTVAALTMAFASLAAIFHWPL